MSLSHRAYYISTIVLWRYVHHKICIYQNNVFSYNINEDISNRDITNNKLGIKRNLFHIYYINYLLFYEAISIAYRQLIKEIGFTYDTNWWHCGIWIEMLEKKTFFSFRQPQNTFGTADLVLWRSFLHPTSNATLWLTKYITAKVESACNVMIY